MHESVPQCFMNGETKGKVVGMQIRLPHGLAVTQRLVMTVKPPVLEAVQPKPSRLCGRTLKLQLLMRTLPTCP